MFLDDELYQIIKERTPTITEANLGAQIVIILEKVITACNNHLTTKIKESKTHKGLVNDLDNAVQYYKFFLEKVLKDKQWYTQTLYMMLRLHNPIANYMRQPAIQELYNKGKS